MRYLLLLLPMSALAAEPQLMCDLERTKAEVRAVVLEAPAAFGTVGQDPVSGSKSVSAGVSQSFSGRAQASKMREAAEATCDAARAVHQVELFTRFGLSDISRQGARAKLKSIEQAITMAKTHIAQLDAQLAASTITVNQHTAARQTLVELEQRQVELLRILSTASLMPSDGNLSNNVDAARRALSRAAQLSAEAAADTGWDVRIAAGSRKELSGNVQAQGFVSLTLSYSFGYSGAKSAARSVGEKTSTFLAAQDLGLTQTLLRARKELTHLVEVETLAEATAARQLQHLSAVRKTVQSVDTALGQNTLREIDIQMKLLEAEKAGASARRDAGIEHLKRME